MKNLRQKKGFTLLETIVAGGVVTVGVLTIVSLLVTALQTTDRIKNTSIAANLAQEGVEVAHNIRTTNWVENDDYDTGLSPGDYCANHDDTALQSCGDFSLFWDGTIYTHTASGAQTTPFERVIAIRHVDNPEEAGTSTVVQVRSTVSWEERSVTAEENLYDWK